VNLIGEIAEELDYQLPMAILFEFGIRDSAYQKLFSASFRRVRKRRGFIK
jgi:hypothetical protein